MIKHLVTGGAGFLGCHLVELLLSEGHEVLIMESFWTGTLDSIARFAENPQFSLLRHDVSQPFPADLQVDRIYHLACPASPKRFPENPFKILETCYEGTKNVLELARKCGARVLLASTSEVYGDPLLYPQSESYWGNVNSFGPRSCYDEGKRVGEALAYAYQLQFNVDVRISRIFNAFGPHMRPDDGRVVPNFISNALAGHDINITGDGKAIRSFQYASDCVAGLHALMNSSYSQGPVNIGRDQETTVEELAVLIRDLVSRKTGKPKVGLNYLPRPDDDPFKRKPDISLARKVLGWEPKVRLEEGLEATIDWFLEIAAKDEKQKVSIVPSGIELITVI